MVQIAPTATIIQLSSKSCEFYMQFYELHTNLWIYSAKTNIFPYASLKSESETQFIRQTDEWNQPPNPLEALLDFKRRNGSFGKFENVLRYKWNPQTPKGDNKNRHYHFFKMAKKTLQSKMVENFKISFFWPTLHIQLKIF